MFWEFLSNFLMGVLIYVQPFIQSCLNLWISEYWKQDAKEVRKFLEIGPDIPKEIREELEAQKKRIVNYLSCSLLTDSDSTHLSYL